jgi:hypothetical protein
MQQLDNFQEWYNEKYYNYIRMYGATIYPHLLPKFVPNRLVLREITYQTILHGFNASLIKDKLKNFIHYSLLIRNYSIINSTFSIMESQAILEYRFTKGIFKRHDPKGMIGKHVIQLGISWPYACERWEEEEVNRMDKS